MKRTFIVVLHFISHFLVVAKQKVAYLGLWINTVNVEVKLNSDAVK